MVVQSFARQRVVLTLWPTVANGTGDHSLLIATAVEQMVAVEQMMPVEQMMT
jgi:phage-related baseplate assembly protein